MLTVYIADDSQLVRDRLKEVLAETGSLQVIGESADSEEARQAIRRLNPDVAILDIRMPGGGGLPVLVDMKSTKPSPVVIVLTAYPDPQHRQAFLAAGADYFFDKTKDIQRMSDVLVELAQKHSGMPKKKILVLGDNPEIIKATASAIEQGREVATIVSDPPSALENWLLAEPSDLYVLVLSSSSPDSESARMNGWLPLQAASVPRLYISRRPFQTLTDSETHYLSFPFAAYELGERVRAILREDPRPISAPAPV